MKVVEKMASIRWLMSCSFVLLVGCSQFPMLQGITEESVTESPRVAEEQKRVVEEQKGYLIGPEDTLEISVWREDSLQREVLVRPDGKISFPLAGDILAAGNTSEHVANEIKKRLTKYIPDPVVSVSVTKVAGYKIYVLGKVSRPGEYMVGRYVDVMQALTLAGGLTPYASENGIKILRRQENRDVVLPFRYAAVRNGVDLDQNIMLKSGDVVVVP